MTQDAFDRPNVLLILTDDQPFHTLYRMVRVRSLLLEAGTDYTSAAYAIEPLCAPMRVALLSGRCPHNTGATTNDGSPSAPSAYEVYRSDGWPQKDLLARLSRVGYRTGFFGKVMNGSQERPGWVHPYADRWVALASGQGQRPYKVNIDGTVREETENHTPYFGARAEAFMRSGPTHGRPWYCQLNWTDPHVPFTPSSDYADTHEGEVYSSPGVSEEDTADKSSWTRESAPYASAAEQQRIYEGMMEELELVDVWIGRIFRALEESGQLENTLVIFTTDNGYMLGEHGGLSKKGLPYEEDVRVPLVVRGPGFEAGATSTRLVSHLDVTATILDVAGDLPAGDASQVDGRSLLSGGTRQRLLIEHPGAGWYMLREGRWSYAELPTGERELYDLTTDPYQLENLASREPEVCAGLSVNMLALARAEGEAFRNLEVAGVALP